MHNFSSFPRAERLSSLNLNEKLLTAPFLPLIMMASDALMVTDTNVIEFSDGAARHTDK